MANKIQFSRGSQKEYLPLGKHQDSVYFATDTHRLLMNGSDYTGGPSIIVSDTQPTDTTCLWVDPTGDENINQEGNLDSIRNSISVLQKQMQQVLRVVQYGAIAGDSSVGARTQLMAAAVPINPNGEDEPSEQDFEPNKLGYTVPNISVKYDTLANFQSNKKNLIDGELIWITDKNQLYIYLQGKFTPISNGSSSTIDDDMTKSDIEELYFSHLGLTDSNNNEYRMEMNDDGTIVVYNNKNYDGNMGSPGETSGSYISDYLRINSVFFGGKGTKLDSFSACSHNYVELANGSTGDINLNGIWILYKAPGSQEWKGLALHGMIKAGSTFLIRGAQCSCKSNITLDVDTYDMIWKDGNDPIQFDLGGGSLYLVVSENDQFYINTQTLASLQQLNAMPEFNPYQTVPPRGYIDFVGIETTAAISTAQSEGGKSLKTTSADNPKDCIFARSFMLDPCSQAQKAYAKRTSSGLWTYINMSKQGTDEFPYYTDKMKHLFAPKGSILHKNIFDTRSTFDAEHPNMLNITFGIQATDNGDGATRCFNWVSVGYYNEYIEYKKQGESWNNAVRVYSINKGNSYTDSNINKFIDIYTRIKWVTTNNTVVTTHKVIIRGLSVGTYDVRIGRDGVDNYDNTTHSFTVRADADVNNGFEFVQTTDQQAFNFYEYQAWEKAAYAIHKNHPNIHFTINTGDMTQNGNRENEWLDYYDARRSLSTIEDMVTIGNNDLCGIIPYELGDGDASKYKINHKNIQLYYCFELDENNPAIFKYDVGAKIDSSLLGDIVNNTETTFDYYMPSLYSFNYGNWHFICLNSEFADTTYRCYYDSSSIAGTFKQHAFYNMYKWLQKDYDANRNNIAYMHEMPFCIIVADSKTAKAEDRTESNGSKLNNDFSGGIAKTPNATDKVEDLQGGGNFAEFFQTHNIKLCLGGHKHTYSLSYPVKENISSNPRTVDFANPIVGEGVVYAMCQATGYKLVSNKELPGADIKWLQKYYAASLDSDAKTVSASSSQYYPMYSVFNLSQNAVSMKSYAVYNIYNEKTAFNINNQYPAFTTKNSEMITGTDITINYIS